MLGGERKEKGYLFSLQCCKALVRSQRNSPSCHRKYFLYIFYMFLFELTVHVCHRLSCESYSKPMNSLVAISFSLRSSV